MHIYSLVADREPQARLNPCIQTQRDIFPYLHTPTHLHHHHYHHYQQLHVGKTADVTVNDSDVDKVLGLSGGAIKGNQVQITVKSKSSKSGSGGGKSTYDKKLSHQNKETLKQYIGMKYNNTNHVLDLRDCTTSLSSIRADFQNTAFVNDIGNIIKNNCPEVRTINFADNDISSLAGFRYFHKSAPNLANLCFSNNPIMSLEELDHLKGYEKKLNELILKGIPAVHGLDSRIYNHEILSRFPTLKLLDLNPVQKLIEFNLPTHVSSVSLPPAKGSFFDTPGSQSTTTDFVQKFFAMYDSNRQKLFTVYNENACFSLSIPANVRYGILPKEYVTHSRNLNTLSSSSTSSSSSSFHSSYKSSAANKQKMADAMVYTLLKQGPAYIVVALDQLPATKHDINSFIADVFVLPSKSGQQLLQLSIHGSFLEVGANVTRKFHRVMLLTPSTNPQWPVCILNDQLFISSQFTKQQQQPVNDQSINVNLSLQSNSNNQVQQQQGSVQQQQEAMARQLSMQGMVSIDVAGQLLMQNNWNFGMATNQLQQLKSMGKL